MLTNGVLIAAAEQEGFDVLVTADKNIPHQQNLTKTGLAIVILENNSWPILQPHVEAIVARITSVSPGTLTSIPIDRPPLRRRPSPSPKT